MTEIKKIWVTCPKCKQLWTKLMPAGMCFDCDAGKTAKANKPEPKTDAIEPTNWQDKYE